MTKKKNPYAICTASVGRKDMNKYERCVKSVKKESIAVIAERVLETLTNQAGRPVNVPKEQRRKYRGMRASAAVQQGLARSTPKPKTSTPKPKKEEVSERCWTGFKQKGMKKKGNRMVPNCVQEMSMEDCILEAYKKAPVTFRDKVRKRIAKGDSRVAAISKEKVAQDDAKTKAAQGKNTPAKTFGYGANQSAETAYGGTASDREKVSKPMTKKQIDRAGTATAKKATPQQKRAANMRLMKDAGLLKFDKEGKRVRR